MKRRAFTKAHKPPFNAEIVWIQGATSDFKRRITFATSNPSSMRFGLSKQPFFFKQADWEKKIGTRTVALIRKHGFIQSFFGPVEMCILNVCADEQIFLTADAYQHWFSSDQALIQAMEEILQSAYLHLQKK